MNGNGSELCTTAGLSINNVELSGPVVDVLDQVAKTYAML
jgi:hypothetical protein